MSLSPAVFGHSGNNWAADKTSRWRQALWVWSLLRDEEIGVNVTDFLCYWTNIFLHVVWFDVYSIRVTQSAREHLIFVLYDLVWPLIFVLSDLILLGNDVRSVCFHCLYLYCFGEMSVICISDGPEVQLSGDRSLLMMIIRLYISWAIRRWRWKREGVFVQAAVWWVCSVAMSRCSWLNVWL